MFGEYAELSKEHAGIAYMDVPGRHLPRQRFYLLVYLWFLRIWNRKFGEAQFKISSSKAQSKYWQPKHIHFVVWTFAMFLAVLRWGPSILPQRLFRVSGGSLPACCPWWGSHIHQLPPEHLQPLEIVIKLDERARVCWIPSNVMKLDSWVERKGICVRAEEKVKKLIHHWTSKNQFRQDALPTELDSFCCSGNNFFSISLKYDGPFCIWW